ncbi:DUF6786 family protein [Rubrolithibacter danxiaensis]|uniref:DUF6786 family protein n=1 Tax=Rubrolithibacter danxiaensis TaxID=3390805 RepID=UPI003BF79CAD
MKRKSFTGFALIALVCFSCTNRNPGKGSEKEKFNEVTFEYDLNYLKGRDSVLVLQNSAGTGQIIVSPKYQGKVFTSTSEGLNGKSFGWINYNAFDKEKDSHMNAYGGEDRLWLGPEGGKYSIFFKPGTKMEFENWHTPAAFDSENWKLVFSDQKKVSMSKEMNLLNYAGTNLNLRIERDILILENKDIESLLKITLTDQVKPVGFKTVNTIINTGDKEWNKQTGAPCLWNLDMFSPSQKTVIVIPYTENTTGKVATTDYFGEISQNRIQYKDGILYFRADGKSRGKLGIPPVRAKNMAGSYDASGNILTITLFDVNKDATYLNQEWTTDKDPFTGDVVNAYNDGPLETGTQMGPFYEIESVSPAAFLKPREKLVHTHHVFHFTGSKAELNVIAQKLLGTSLQQIETAFIQ